jgi:hypothetical protein
MKTLYTGGAPGADLLFEECAIKKDYEVVAYSFEGHNTLSTKRKILFPEELEEANVHVRDAAEYLGRTYSNHDNEYVFNLLRRNWFQIKDATSVYAVSEFQDLLHIQNTKINRYAVVSKVRVKGGTGWAVAMALLAGDKNVYVFDQIFGEWYSCRPAVNTLSPVYTIKPLGDVPTPPEKFAGIGTRKLNERGIYAIKSLFRWRTE